jgi:hypothetical protein
MLSPGLLAALTVRSRSCVGRQVDLNTDPAFVASDHVFSGPAGLISGPRRHTVMWTDR